MFLQLMKRGIGRKVPEHLMSEAKMIMKRKIPLLGWFISISLFITACNSTMNDVEQLQDFTPTTPANVEYSTHTPTPQATQPNPTRP